MFKSVLQFAVILIRIETGYEYDDAWNLNYFHVLFLHDKASERLKANNLKSIH